MSYHHGQAQSKYGILTPSVPGFIPVNSNTGWCVLYVGGNYNNASNAGPFYFNGNNASSNTNANIGARLLVFKVFAWEIPHRLVEILPHRTGPSRYLSKGPAGKQGKVVS